VPRTASGLNLSLGAPVRHPELSTAFSGCREFRGSATRCSCDLGAGSGEVMPFHSLQTRRHDCHRWPCGCSSTPFMKQLATRSNSGGGQSWTIIGPTSANPPFATGRNPCVKTMGSGMPCVHAATTNTSSLPSGPRTRPSRANAQRSKCSLYLSRLAHPMKPTHKTKVTHN
jgi:hypothetical protein